MTCTQEVISLSNQRTVGRLIGLVALLVLGAAFSGACGGGEDNRSSTASPAADTTVTTTPVEPGPTDIEIVRPTPNEAVPLIITVEFESSELAYVLVRPIPEDPNQQYWVQAAAESTGGNRWKANPVYVGQETDPSGLPFKVCVVITDETLSRGQSLSEIPEGPSHCVDVTRQ